VSQHQSNKCALNRRLKCEQLYTDVIKITYCNTCDYSSSLIMVDKQTFMLHIGRTCFLLLIAAVELHENIKTPSVLFSG